MRSRNADRFITFKNDSRFLDAKHMTDERVVRIRKYNQQIEAKFGIKHTPAAFNEEEKNAMKKLKRVLYHLLQHNIEEKQEDQLRIPTFVINILGLNSAFDIEGESGKLKEDTAQDTLDFLDNDDQLPDKKEEDKCLRNLERGFLALVTHVVNLPEGRRLALGPEVSDNLELQVSSKNALFAKPILFQWSRCYDISFWRPLGS